ncbi:hypothetical protein DM01DRAFT_47127 [Hesseltinella vesiculosa]|uniref:Uncharacterized protein n=1 Tax=Hesseltinella vesiculosa TaxID=101127 RepID=A0A1X2GXC1_9FUNG|nr:hypothetical protein DM01DRAFT_47127 [Hesseltinella vesiculosa]
MPIYPFILTSSILLLSSGFESFTFFLKQAESFTFFLPNTFKLAESFTLFSSQ